MTYKLGVPLTSSGGEACMWFRSVGLPNLPNHLLDQCSLTMIWTWLLLLGTLYISRLVHTVILLVSSDISKKLSSEEALEILVLKAKIQWHYPGGLSNAIQPNLPFRKSVKMRNAAWWVSPLNNWSASFWTNLQFRILTLIK